jgi:subtilase family serine protease
MRLRHVMTALVPVGAASALAVLPVGTPTAANASPVAATAATSAAGRVTPGVDAPLAYAYVGKAGSAAASSGYQFSCQEPGAALNCYTPEELATAYDIPSKLTGAGQTIVIIDAFGDPTIGADVATEDSTFGLPAANLSIIYPNGQPAFDASNADEVNWTGEIALDVESAHAVAPAAKIDLVVAKSDQDPDILNALRYVVSHHLGNVLSQSYGEAESCEAASIQKADHALFAQAEAEHMTVFASSGDYGAAQPNCDGSSYLKSVGLPAADPLVTGVGATSLTASQPNGAYESETAWNDAYGSSNGGYSTVFNRPAFQNGFVRSAMRGVPDVSYSGDVNNGLLVAWSGGVAANEGTFYLFGGTSAGSPQWSAITALADQQANHPLGYLNDQLYSLARGPHYGSVFHDVTKGNNTVSLTASNGKLVNITGYQTAKGWDPVTGLGTPNVARLLQYLG